MLVKFQDPGTLESVEFYGLKNKCNREKPSAIIIILCEVYEVVGLYFPPVTTITITPTQILQLGTLAKALLVNIIQLKTAKKTKQKTTYFFHF